MIFMGTNLSNNVSPVFIAGCGRSGTTFLRFVLNCKNEVFIPNECGFLIDYLKFGRYVPEALLRKLLFNEPQLRLWYKNDPIKIYNIGHTVRKIHECRALQSGCKTWGQKTPKFVRYIQLFEKHVGGSIKWVLIYRDPRAVVSSMLKSERHTYSISRAVKRWRQDNKILIDLMRSSNKQNMLFVKYEDLIENYEKQADKIFGFTGLDKVNVHDLEKKGHPDAYLDGSKLKNITVDKTFIPNSESINKWKKTLNHHQIMYIEKKCTEEMRFFKYSKCYKDSKITASVRIQDLIGYLKIIKIIGVFLKNWPFLPFYMGIRKTILYFFYYAKKVFTYFL